MANEAPLSDASDSEGNSSLVVCCVRSGFFFSSLFYFSLLALFLPSYKIDVALFLFTAELRDELIDETTGSIFPALQLLLLLVGRYKISEQVKAPAVFRRRPFVRSAQDESLLLLFYHGFLYMTKTTSG